MDTTQSRILRPKRLRTLGWLALCAGFAAVGVWMVLSENALGWFVVVIFGIGMLVFAVLLLPNSAYLRIGPDGFTVCSLFRAHSYTWSDVGPFTVGRIGGNRMVVFDFSEHYRRVPRARKVALAIAGHEGALPDSYGMPLEALAELLNEYREQHVAV